MSSSHYEIVELPNGDMALRRAGGDDEPIVSIHFSKESLFFLKDAKFEIAKAMLEAGLEATGSIAEQEDSLFEMASEFDSQLLH